MGTKAFAPNPAVQGIRPLLPLTSLLRAHQRGSSSQEAPFRTLFSTSRPTRTSLSILRSVESTVLGRPGDVSRPLSLPYLLRVVPSCLFVHTQPPSVRDSELELEVAVEAVDDMGHIPLSPASSFGELAPSGQFADMTSSTCHSRPCVAPCEIHQSFGSDYSTGHAAIQTQDLFPYGSNLQERPLPVSHPFAPRSVVGRGR